jgi:hypothetical protein
VNRELALLKRVLSLASKAGKLKQIPYIPSLKENNVRQGFLKLDGYARMAEETSKVGSGPVLYPNPVFDSYPVILDTLLPARHGSTTG